MGNIEIEILDAQLKVLQVAQSEVSTLKPQRAVYEKKGALFFISTKASAAQNIAAKVSSLKDQRKVLAEQQQGEETEAI